MLLVKSFVNVRALFIRVQRSGLRASVFVPEQFVHTELLFYKGAQNQGKSGLDKNQVSDKIIQDKTVLPGSIQV